MTAYLVLYIGHKLSSMATKDNTIDKLENAVCPVANLEIAFRTSDGLDLHLHKSMCRHLLHEVDRCVHTRLLQQACFYYVAHAINSADI